MVNKKGGVRKTKHIKMNKEKLKRSQDHKKQKEANDKKQIKLWIEKYRPKSLSITFS